MSDAPIELFRRLTSGVYVIGVAWEGKSNAFTAAWVTQTSFDPLYLALNVHTGNFSYPLVKASGAFVVNVLAEGQIELARQFGTRSGRDGDKLAGVRWQPAGNGAPILLDALAHIECRVVSATPAGDHEVLIAHATGGLVHRPGSPLLYRDTGELDGSASLFPAKF
ncbi:MAG: flavin reductase family protein [Gemmatimonadota bacterium]